MNLKTDLKDRHSYYASSDLLSELKSKMKENDFVINFAYTDYGGDFFDKVAIAYFEKEHPESIVIESTSWYGQNAFVFGDIAKEFAERTENYLLGFENIKEFYLEMEHEERMKGIEFFKESNRKFEFTENIPDEFIEWVEGYCNVLTSGLDYSKSEMIKKAVETGFIIETEN